MDPTDIKAESVFKFAYTILAAPDFSISAYLSNINRVGKTPTQGSSEGASFTFHVVLEEQLIEGLKFIYNVTLDSRSI